MSRDVENDDEEVDTEHEKRKRRVYNQINKILILKNYFNLNLLIKKYFFKASSL